MEDTRWYRDRKLPALIQTATKELELLKVLERVPDVTILRLLSEWRDAQDVRLLVSAGASGEVGLKCTLPPRLQFQPNP